VPTYDGTRFNPPAPLAYVTLRNRETGVTWTDVPMLLDTGADVTLVPRAVQKRLGISAIPSGSLKLLGFDGTESVAHIVDLELGLLGRIYRGEFLLIDQEYGVLGRNLLNTLSLVFDGPRLVWDEMRRG
jgi:predicted aspartyl protease